MKKTLILVVLIFGLLFGPAFAAYGAQDQQSRYLEILVKIEALLRELKELIQITTPVTPQPVGEETLTLSLNSPVVNKLTEMELNLVEVGNNYADIEVNYFDRNNYPGTKTSGTATGWVPNPQLYPEYYTGSDLLSVAKNVYRTHKWCDGTMKEDVWNKGYQIIELAGYSNYLCRNRFKEQCVLDGTYDNYYDERCDFGRLRFTLGEIKSSSNFAIQLTKIISSSEVEVKVIDKDRTALISPGNIELMRAKGEAGIYAVDTKRNIKMPVTDSSVLESYGLKTTKAKEVEVKTLENYQTSKPVGLKEGSLVKEKNNATVYVVDDGELKPVASPSALKKAGYDWKNLKVVSEKVIDLYSVGEAIK